jgi:hypothetical protein
MSRRNVVLVLIGIVGGSIFSVMAIDNLLPFRGIDLKLLLIQPNDLPATLFADGFKSDGPDLNRHYDMMGMETIFSAPDEIAGQVWVYIFHSIKDGNLMFNQLSLSDVYVESQEGVPIYQMPEVGDTMFAMPIYVKEQGGMIINLSFQRCYSVVHIQFHTNNSHQSHEADFVTYARKLDERLKTTTCDKVKNFLGR